MEDLDLAFFKSNLAYLKKYSEVFCSENFSDGLLLKCSCWLYELCHEHFPSEVKTKSGGIILQAPWPACFIVSFEVSCQSNL